MNYTIKSFSEKISFIRQVMNASEIYQLKTVDGIMINFFDVTSEDQIIVGVKTDAKDGDYDFSDKTITVKGGEIAEIKVVEKPVEEEVVEEPVVEEVVVEDVKEEVTETETVEEPVVEEAPVVEEVDVIAELTAKIDELLSKIDSLEKRVEVLEGGNTELSAKVQNLSKFATQPTVEKQERVEEVSTFSFRRK